MTTPTEYLNCPLEKITWFFSLFSQSPLGGREDEPGLLIPIWLDLAEKVIIGLRKPFTYPELKLPCDTFSCLNSQYSPLFVSSLL